MANYAVTTSIVLIDHADESADTVSGSAAKAISDLVETIDNTKTIRLFSVVKLTNTQSSVIITYDA